MKYISLLIAFLAVVNFSGCSSSWDLDSLFDDKNSKVTIGSSDYYMADGVSKAESLENDRGIVLESGDNQEVSGFVATSSSTPSLPTFKGGSLQLSSALETVDTFVTDLGNMLNVNTVNVLTKQVFSNPVEVAIVDMEVEMSSSYSSMEVIELMLKDILGLEDTYELSDKEAKESTGFRVLFAAVKIDGVEYYIATAIPESAYSEYGGVASLVVSASNFVEEDAEIDSDTDKFTSVAGSNKADFLFVVDDSGSMSDEQSALAQVATDFKTAITNAGLTDFKIAIISTGTGIDTIGGSANQVLNAEGIIDDISVFENSIVLGTGGSTTETGIYNAEYSLNTNGVLKNNFPFPRANTSLSVIILSDEPSHYTSRSGGTAFDVTNNIFVTNKYVIHSIVKQGSSGQYEDLSAATGGYSANISSSGTSGLDYSSIMDLITIQAGGASSAFELSHDNVMVSTIRVEIDGKEILAGTTNGWTFNQSSNTIAFFGDARPEGGEKITIDYEYQK